MQSQLKILFLDDHAGLRDGIGFLLSQKNGRLKFFYATNREESEKILRENSEISLAIIDLNLEDEGKDGLSALKAFRKIKSDLKAIIFTMYADPIHIERSLKAGIQGYVTKNAEIEELENAILTVASGKTCFNSAASRIMQQMISPDNVLEVKFSTVMKENDDKIRDDNVIEQCLKANLANRAMTAEEIENYNFDCNIQQIKRKEFDVLYYGLFFADIIEIFRMNSNEILSCPGYSDKQHRGNEGEGQFHLNQDNIKYHRKEHQVLVLSYQELYELFKK